METVAQNAVLRPHAVQHQIVNSLDLKLFMKKKEWLGDRDLNPDWMVQSHLSYR